MTARQYVINLFGFRRNSNVMSPQGRWVTILKAQWSPNPDVYPHFTVSFLIVMQPAGRVHRGGRFRFQYAKFPSLLLDWKHEAFCGCLHSQGKIDAYVRLLVASSCRLCLTG